MIAAALKSQDTLALSALKNNTGKPIRFVFSAFMYLLMESSWEENHEEGYVVIYGIEARKTLLKLACLDQEEDQSVAEPSTLPLDTYDFLL
ncbi:hypothetical protein [Spirosoma endophyticum]|uniref:Uncharacterized protein n=1 Tax=Spirosoma endophyticum TaxID=662367 RepID=A0A1I2GZ80_9BACT|nr:hypothetical protein [Spirosoma endophyticum]SFF22067.1 hypothetical protein SAMN05216167_13622 [Spirosoma endophyticum]